MPLVCRPTIVEGKVYRGKKKQDGDDESRALKELELILSGKRRKQCDCEAQVHDLLENCLECGRLTCEAEGPGKCFSCDSIVLSQEQRDRLMKHVDFLRPIPCGSLRVDQSRPTARIIDRQFDHFAIDNKKHLREEERSRLKAELDELQAKRHKRKMMLQVDVDAFEAGMRSVPLVDDYEAELSKLQLGDSTLDDSTQNHNLAQLVHLEFKKNYQLVYIDSAATVATEQATDENRNNSKVESSGNANAQKSNRKRSKRNPRNKVSSNEGQKHTTWQGKNVIDKR